MLMTSRMTVWLTLENLVSIKERTIPGLVTEKTKHCDGPQHEGPTNMVCSAVTVIHGFGSKFDGEHHHFCSFSCLGAWTDKNTREETALREASKVRRR